jgi:acyl-CoA reductase-like NAD-dependent aldehyde dehydrogenase
MSNLARDLQQTPKLPPTELLIDGEWCEAKTGERFETRSPATGETITTVARAGHDDVPDAVAAARRASESGPWELGRWR